MSMGTYSRRTFLGAAVATVAVQSVWSQKSGIDVAYLNASVWTGVPAAPLSDAIGIKGNRIIAIGADAVRAATSKKTKIIDLDGAFITPGFVDPHTHFLLGSAMLAQPNLRDAATPLEFTKRLGDAAKTAPAGQWLQGGHWDEQLWGGELPRKQWIDAATPDTPVAVSRLDLHMYLCNSLALTLAGITRDTPDPEGGVIVRDANGEPTGIVKDAAKGLIDRVVPALSNAAIDANTRRGIAYGLSKGVTQVHATELDWTTHDSLRRLRARGETDMRFYSFLPLKDWAKVAALVKAEGKGDDWVRWGGLKGLMDGSLGSRTALFKDPYTDAPDSHGIALDSLTDMKSWIQQADSAGLHVTTHAIGDAANAQLLDIYAAVVRTNGARDRRFRIEHAQHLSPADIPRFKAQNIVASVQPYHAIDDGRWAITRIGPDRLNGTYSFRSLIDSGAHVSFGSDWPVAPFDPLTGLAGAVLRQTIDGANPDGWIPEERVTVEQALHAYTAANAYAGFQEDRLGIIAPGMIADFVVFDTDLARENPAKIADAEVLRTIVDGRQRYGSHA